MLTGVQGGSWTVRRLAGKNGRVSAARDFVDDTLQREASCTWGGGIGHRFGGGLEYYGASVGAVRGTVRDALRRHGGLAHDEVTALSSELWEVPFTSGGWPVVLLQSKVELLTNSDLTV